MIDPDDYWVNNPLITPINKALMYDNDMHGAAVEERYRIIELLDAEHSEYTYQHQENKGAYIDDCPACFAIAIIKGEN